MGTADLTELDALIEVAAKRGYLWHQFRVDRHGPDVLAGAYQWALCADVVVLADERNSHAYRTPTGPTTDVFAPTRVHWWYGRSDDSVAPPAKPGQLRVLPGISPVWTLRALLTLPTPDEPGGLLPPMPAPKGTGVAGDRVPVRIRRWLGR
ncbi:hypothetical protein [Actinophytocola sediminis]